MLKRDQDLVENAAGRRQQRRLAHLKLLKWGRGVQRPEIARRLGVGVGQVSEILNGSAELSAESQSVIVETLGIDEGEFHDGVAGRFHAEVYLARVKQQWRRQAEHVEERARKYPAKPYDRHRLPKLAAGLQELRLLDAAAARRQAFDILAIDFHGPASLEPVALCQTHVALGAIYRNRGNYGGTAHFLLQALHSAGGDPTLRAPVLQAVASLARDLGDPDEGIEAAVQAGAACLISGNYPGLGRSLIALGSLYLYAGHLTLALGSLRCGMPMVSEGSWFDRYAGHQVLAFCHLHREEFEEALVSAERGLKVLDSDSASAPLQRAAILWLRAEVHLAERRPSPAVRDLQDVLQVYLNEGFSALDCALVATRLAHALLLTGDVEAVKDLTVRVSGLVNRFKKGEKLLAATFADVLRQARAGEVTSDLLAESYRALLKSAERAPPEARLPLISRRS